jgi:hypothetical protein
MSSGETLAVKWREGSGGVNDEAGDIGVCRGVMSILLISQWRSWLAALS